MLLGKCSATCRGCAALEMDEIRISATSAGCATLAPDFHWFWALQRDMKAPWYLPCPQIVCTFPPFDCWSIEVRGSSNWVFPAACRPCAEVAMSFRRLRDFFIRAMPLTVWRCGPLDAALPLVGGGLNLSK